MILLFNIFYSNHFILFNSLILLFALGLDLIIGDFKSKYHPVNIIGLSIIFLENKLKKGKPKLDKVIGIVLIVLVILIFCVPLLFIQILIFELLFSLFFNNNLNLIIIIIFSLLMSAIFKWSFALKSLGDATIPIKNALINNNLEKARYHLTFIVRRNCHELDKSYIISGAVECIAESITDGIIGTLWFYFIGSFFGIIVYKFFHQRYLWLLLGIPFAYIYRIINTADSIVGYKDKEHVNIGWFSARMDDIANYIPTRIIIIFMILVGKILGYNIKNALRIIKNDRNKTESINAGWTIGTMAGLLNIQLEKIGKYKLGNPNRSLEPEDIAIAYRIYKLTVLLFTLFLLLLFIIIWFVLY